MTNPEPAGIPADASDSTTSGPTRTPPDAPIVALARGMRRLGIVGAILGIALGIAALVWPGETLVVIAYLFGFGVIVGGVHRLAAAISFAVLPTGMRWLLGILGALMAIAGFIALLNPVGTLLFLAIWIGAAWAVGGVFDIAAGVSGATTGPRWWAIVSGVLGVIAAVVVWTMPGVALGTFVFVGAIALIIVSISTLFVLPKAAGEL